MIRFEYLKKQEKESWLPKLFDLFYENMQLIVSDPAPYTEQMEEWLSQVSPALDKAPRQVVLCLDGDRLAGFCMYYTRQELLMVEELQISKKHQKTTVFYSLCRFLRNHLPKDTVIIEAYAHKQNRNSLKLMGRMDMEIVEESVHGDLVHLRGNIQRTGFLRMNKQ